MPALIKDVLLLLRRLGFWLGVIAGLALAVWMWIDMLRSGPATRDCVRVGYMPIAGNCEQHPSP